METTEITEKVIPHKKIYITKNPFDIAWEERTKKLKIIRYFRVFVLRPIPKYENSEITEMLQKCHNTELWECSFKNSWDVLQITSASKWFTHIPNQVPGVCLLRAPKPSRFIKLSSFSYFSFSTQKVQIVIKK